VNPKTVRVLDTTLREGEQTPGICFPPHAKAAIADILETMGIDIIEAGHPLVSSRTWAGVLAVRRRIRRALVAAHARTKPGDLVAALDCGVDLVGIFFCVSDQRLAHHDITLNAAIDRICSIIRQSKEQAPEVLVRYTPEDTVRSAWKNVRQAACAAVDAGADIISVADTTGAMIPGGEHSLKPYVARMQDEFSRRGLNAEIAVHCHNDRGLALANALDGIRGGATIVDASVLGLGERAGIVDLATLLSALCNDMGLDHHWDLTRLPHLYNTVSRFSGIQPGVNAPIIGRHAFTHCAGVHTQAALNNPVHYESLHPEMFGRSRKVALDHMSGMSSLRYSLEQIGCDELDPELTTRLLDEVKHIGHSGRCIDLVELRWLVDSIRSEFSSGENHDSYHPCSFADPAG